MISGVPIPVDFTSPLLAPTMFGPDCTESEPDAVTDESGAICPGVDEATCSSGREIVDLAGECRTDREGGTGESILSGVD